MTDKEGINAEEAVENGGNTDATVPQESADERSEPSGAGNGAPTTEEIVKVVNFLMGGAESAGLELADMMAGAVDEDDMVISWRVDFRHRKEGARTLRGSTVIHAFTDPDNVADAAVNAATIVETNLAGAVKNHLRKILVKHAPHDPVWEVAQIGLNNDKEMGSM